MFEKLGLRARDNPQLDLQSPTVVPLLMYLADDSDVDVRRLALRNLPYHKENFHAAFAPIFERHLHDPDAGCRFASARGLWAIKKERDAIAVVIPLREIPDRHTRWEAIDLLSNMASLEPTLFDILAPLTEDSDPSVGRLAIQAMGHFGKRGVPIIQKYLRGTDKALSSAAIVAASRLREGTEEVYPDLLALQADPNEDVARNASHALYMMDPKRFPKPATWGD